MSNVCNFDVNGECYAPKCFSNKRCRAKNGDGKINYASDRVVKERSAGMYDKVKIVVMKPTVTNVENGPSQNMSWKEIPLSRGLFTKVDTSDYEWLIEWKWFARKSRDTYYAYRNGRDATGKRIVIIMHREIMKTPDDMQTDHKDWDGLNNRRYNLRNCTVSQNRGWIKPRGKIRYLGVSEHRWFKKKTNTFGVSYEAFISNNGKPCRLGIFKDAISAAKAYDAKAKELRGEFANLNFPEKIVCRNGNPLKYKDCIEYNTVFCRAECEFGTKEKSMTDVNLDYQREDGK